MLVSGKNNIVNKMKSEAIELTFGVPAKEVEEIFEKETDYLLFPGPSQQEKEGRADAWDPKGNSYIYIAREILLGYGFVREINEGFRNVNSVMYEK